MRSRCAHSSSRSSSGRTTGSIASYLTGVDQEALIAAARAELAEGPKLLKDVADALGERWPGVNRLAIASAVRAWIPLVQPPPRGIWGKGGVATHAPAAEWLAATSARAMTIDDLVLRYLRAFGPATVMDAQAWSGLTKLREVVERLRPRLRTFRDERGRELFDLPDAPRPPAETPAPPRFMPEYDNIFLAHADRSRIGDPRHGAILSTETGMVQALLIDGFVAGTWRIVRERANATLVVEHFDRMSKTNRTAVVAEGRRLLEFCRIGRVACTRRARAVCAVGRTRRMVNASGSRPAHGGRERSPARRHRRPKAWRRRGRRSHRSGWRQLH